MLMTPHHRQEDLCVSPFWYASFFSVQRKTSILFLDAYPCNPLPFAHSMPLIKSAIKRARQNTVRRQRLLPFRSSMKTMVRKVVDAAKAGNKAEAEKLLPAAFKAVDTAAKKRIIHRKTASRKKSLLSRLVAKL